MPNLRIRSTFDDSSDSDILITEKLSTLNNSFDDKRRYRYNALKPGEIYKLRKIRNTAMTPKKLAPINTIKTPNTDLENQLRVLELQTENFELRKKIQALGDPDLSPG